MPFMPNRKNKRENQLTLESDTKEHVVDGEIIVGFILMLYSSMAIRTKILIANCNVVSIHVYFEFLYQNISSKYEKNLTIFYYTRYTFVVLII